jgi:uncharacterized FAD-dependent dehydrogenase
MSTTIPTLKATPGDISLVCQKNPGIHKRDNICIEQVAPEPRMIFLLYGVEAKYYSIRPQTNDNFEISKNVTVLAWQRYYAEFVTSGAMGIYVAKKILGNAER